MTQELIGENSKERERERERERKRVLQKECVEIKKLYIISNAFDRLIYSFHYRRRDKFDRPNLTYHGKYLSIN